MGKYSKVLEGRERLKPELSPYQEAVEKVKGELLASPTQDLVHGYVEARRKKEAEEQKVSEINLVIEALSQLLEARFEAEDLTTVKTAAGDSVTVQLEPYAAVEDKEAYRVWCLEQGYEREMHLWPSTTSAIVKERLLSGEPEPPGVKAMVKAKVVFRKA